MRLSREFIRSNRQGTSGKRKLPRVRFLDVVKTFDVEPIHPPLGDDYRFRIEVVRLRAGHSPVYASKVWRIEHYRVRRTSGRIVDAALAVCDANPRWQVTAATPRKVVAEVVHRIADTFAAILPGAHTKRKTGVNGPERRAARRLKS